MPRRMGDKKAFFPRTGRKTESGAGCAGLAERRQKATRAGPACCRTAGNAPPPFKKRHPMMTQPLVSRADHRPARFLKEDIPCETLRAPHLTACRSVKNTVFPRGLGRTALCRHLTFCCLQWQNPPTAHRGSARDARPPSGKPSVDDLFYLFPEIACKILLTGPHPPPALPSPGCRPRLRPVRRRRPCGRARHGDPRPRDGHRP